MMKNVVALVSVCVGMTVAGGHLFAEEAADDLSAIDEELAAERRDVPAPLGGHETDPGLKAAEGETGAVAVQKHEEPQSPAEQIGDGWVKRDMGEICSKIDILAPETKKGRKFQFDRDDLDTSRTGKPGMMPRDGYNDNL